MRNLWLGEIRGWELRPQKWMAAACEEAGGDGETIAASNVTKATVRRALAHLPRHQRTALILICVDGMSYQETAESLDMPLGVVTRLIARARDALHEQIAMESRTNVRGSVIPALPAPASRKRGEH